MIFIERRRKRGGVMKEKEFEKKKVVFVAAAVAGVAVVGMIAAYAIIRVRTDTWQKVQFGWLF